MLVSDRNAVLTIEIPEGTLEVESSIAPFLPPAFVADPMRYFDEYGKRVRRGTVVTYNAAGRVDDDPNAVRDFPEWSDPGGQELRVVCKRVNPTKSMVRRSGNPFYEYRIMQLVRELGFVTARPLARLTQRDSYFFLTERVEGFRWVERRKSGFDDAACDGIRAEAEALIAPLEAAFLEIGIRRPWHVKDLIMTLDPDAQTVRAVIPIDWEETRLDFDMLRHSPVGHFLHDLRPRTD
jgi:hypothetical protein